MQPPTPSPIAPVLMDSARLVEAVHAVIDWYSWYVSPERDPMTAADYERFLAAAAPLEPITRLNGPIGDAAHVLLVGGAGYSTEQILDALDVLDELVHPAQSAPPAWRRYPPPTIEAATPIAASTPSDMPSGGWVEVPLPGL